MILIPIAVGLYLIGMLGYMYLVLSTWSADSVVGAALDQYPVMLMGLLVLLGSIWPIALYWMLVTQAMKWAKS